MSRESTALESLDLILPFLFPSCDVGSMRCKCLEAISKIKSCEWFPIPWLNVVGVGRKLPLPVLCNCLPQESRAQIKHRNYFEKLFVGVSMNQKQMFISRLKSNSMWSLQNVTTWQCLSSPNSAKSVVVDRCTTILPSVQSVIAEITKMCINLRHSDVLEVQMILNATQFAADLWRLNHLDKNCIWCNDERSV